MSWYVRYLLSNSIKIREKTLNDDNISWGDNIFFVDSNEPVDYFDGISDNKSILDSDEYSDLLSVEMAIKVLSENKILNDTECIIIEFMKNGAVISDMVEKLSISKPTIYSAIKTLSNKIAFYLGEHFTDIGFIEKMNITSRQSVILKKYMETN